MIAFPSLDFVSFRHHHPDLPRLLSYHAECDERSDLSKRLNYPHHPYKPPKSLGMDHMVEYGHLLAPTILASQ